MPLSCAETHEPPETFQRRPSTASSSSVYAGTEAMPRR